MYPLANMSEEVEYMDTSDTPWCWYYLADCGRWHRFEGDTGNLVISQYMESCYQRDKNGVFKIASGTGSQQINFAAMLQTDLTTGRQRVIKRSYLFETRCSCFISVPVFWEMVDPTLPYQLIPLNEVTPEYQTVADYVKKDGLLKNSIISISRIQNIDLWEMFCRKKQQLMRIKGVKEIKEGRLFHGTDKSNVDSICTYNFDLGLAGTCGHTYGKGIYFAKYAAFADKYSRGNAAALPLYSGAPQGVQGQQSKIIFLARVIIGKSKMGESHFQKPDHGSSANDHDSCVDDTNNPKIFVIFNPNQIYPEYLIEYS